MNSKSRGSETHLLLFMVNFREYVCKYRNSQGIQSLFFDQTKSQCSGSELLRSRYVTSRSVLWLPEKMTNIYSDATYISSCRNICSKMYPCIRPILILIGTLESTLGYEQLLTNAETPRLNPVHCIIGGSVCALLGDSNYHPCSKHCVPEQHTYLIR